MIKFLKDRVARKKRAKTLYDQAEAQARLPFFYESLSVPDSVDGRFEMIAMHCYIYMRRLQNAGDKVMSQKVFDVFFRHMDVTMREMGIGDLAVPKHMKRMMQGFNGRANHYEAAILSGDIDELKQAIVNNIYGTVDKVSDADVGVMTDYIMKNIEMSDVDEGFASIDGKGKKHA